MKSTVKVLKRFFVKIIYFRGEDMVFTSKALL